MKDETKKPRILLLDQDDLEAIAAGSATIEERQQYFIDTYLDRNDTGPAPLAALKRLRQQRLEADDE